MMGVFTAKFNKNYKCGYNLTCEMNRKGFAPITLIIIVIFTTISMNTCNEMCVLGNIEVPFAVSSGGLIFTPLNSSLMMLKAEVNYDVQYTILENYTKPQHYINYNFIGSYIIYNPNDTLIATVVIPLTERDSIDEVDNLEVKVNDSLLSCDMIPIWSTDYIDIIDKYIPINYQDVYNLNSLIVFNTSFESNSLYNVVYSYSCSVYRGPYLSYGGYDYLSGCRINYFLSTSELWNNYIDETVIMLAGGAVKPNYYTLPCIVTQYDGINNYNWSWHDEPIDKIYVEIVYEYFEPEPTGIGLSGLYSPLILAILLYTIQRRRKLV